MIRRHVLPAIGEVKLKTLTAIHVERMTNDMVTAGISPTTAVGARVVLRRALSDAIRDGVLGRNAAALAHPPKKVYRELPHLDAAQLRTLLDGAGADTIGAVITVAATIGLRQGELLGLRWSDIDLKVGTLTVSRSMALARDGSYHLAETKTRRSRRTINLPARAIVALRQEQERQERLKATAADAWQDRNGLVFTDQAGKPLTGDRVWRQFRNRLTTLGLHKIPFHGLRHSAATAMLTAGVPLKIVSEVLGHSSIAVTGDTYAHVAPELRRDAADAMDRLLG